jgi:hypothetical protein
VESIERSIRTYQNRRKNIFTVLQVDDGNDQAIDTFNATYFKNSLKTEEQEYNLLDADEL